MTLLEVSGLDVRHGLLQAVRSVDLQVDDGERVALVGANGAGKTTLLRTVAGALRPDGGSISFAGRDITRMPAHRRVQLGISLVPEGRRLFPDLTVEENLMVAGRHGPRGGWTVDRVLEAFPMLRPVRGHRAATLSGGEQQATAIGRALMNNPRLVLLDEVSLGLAPMAVDAVYSSLQSLLDGGAAVLVVEQDLGREMSLDHRDVCMLRGRVVPEGPSQGLSREQVTEAYFGLRRSGGQRTGSGTGTA